MFLRRDKNSPPILGGLERVDKPIFGGFAKSKASLV